LNVSIVSRLDGHCKKCGFSQHVDEVGDRVCWCDTCGDTFDWELAVREAIISRRSRDVDKQLDGHCEKCGCSQHVDEVGDRVCWCDTCGDTIDWELVVREMWL